MLKSFVTFWRVSTRPVTVDDLEVPGFRLHALKGDLKGFWAVVVRANWRVIFRFVDRDVVDVDYIDYH